MSSSDSELLEAGVSDDDLLEEALVRLVRGPYRLQTQGVPFLAGVVVDSLLPETLPNSQLHKHILPTPLEVVSGLLASSVVSGSLCWRTFLAGSLRLCSVVLGVCMQRLHHSLGLIITSLTLAWMLRRHSQNVICQLKLEGAPHFVQSSMVLKVFALLQEGVQDV